MHKKKASASPSKQLTAAVTNPAVVDPGLAPGVQPRASSALPVLIGMLEKLSIVTAENADLVGPSTPKYTVSKPMKSKKGWGWRDNSTKVK